MDHAAVFLEIEQNLTEIRDVTRWLAAVATGGAAASPAVLERVQRDYETRLVIQKGRLAGRVRELREYLASADERRRRLEEGLAEASLDAEEIALRRSVGEFSDGEYQEKTDAIAARSRAIQKNLGLLAEFGEICHEAILAADPQRPVTPDRIEAAPVEAPFAPAGAATPAMSGPERPATPEPVDAIPVEVPSAPAEAVTSPTPEPVLLEEIVEAEEVVLAVSVEELPASSVEAPPAPVMTESPVPPTITPSEPEIVASPEIGAPVAPPAEEETLAPVEAETPVWAANESLAQAATVESTAAIGFTEVSPEELAALRVDDGIPSAPRAVEGSEANETVPPIEASAVLERFDVEPESAAAPGPEPQVAGIEPETLEQRTDVGEPAAARGVDVPELMVLTDIVPAPVAVPTSEPALELEKNPAPAASGKEWDDVESAFFHAEPATPQLEFVRIDTAAERVLGTIGAQGASIGSARGCEIRIDDASVAGKHARVFYELGSFVIKDAGGRHGVFLNGRRIAREEIKAGDVLKLGKARIRVR